MWTVDKQWTLFLDRDGVINVRIPNDYVKTPQEFIFIKGVPESIAQFKKIFGHVFVVTNQQGIGKGIMTESNLAEVHDYMQENLKSVGGEITRFYFAPQLASEDSLMRKPNSGMALKAKEEFPSIDFERSIMVGDSDSDIEFGKRLGMKTVKVDPHLNDQSGADACIESLNELNKLLNL
jgi:D-glycero-D-manno-heptose 1,7-bisphosphate phosphatase